MICGECGSPYRRVTWNSHGHKLIVWRCINRLDHGSKYCKNSPSINEEKLQNVIVSALNSVYTGDSNFMSIIEDNIGCVLSEEDELGQAITNMENRIQEIEKMRDNLISLVTTGAVDIESSDDKFKALNSEEKYLRDQIEQLKLKAQTKTDLRLMLKTISDEQKNYDDSIVKYNETAVRKVVECVKVISKTEVELTFKGGFDMMVEVEK